MPALLVVTPPGPDSDTLCANLRERGYVVHTAESGHAAIDVALRRVPDVILMDPALSAMDRWHAVKRLNTEIVTSTIPVLTLASDVTSPAGLQRVLGKIDQTLGRRGGMRRRSTEPPPPRSERRRSGEGRPGVISTEPPLRSVPPGSARSVPPGSARSVPPASSRSVPPSSSGTSLPPGVAAASTSIPPASVAPGGVAPRSEPPPVRPAPVSTARPPLPDAPESQAAAVRVGAGSTTPAAPPRRSTREKGHGRLLVVDDNALNRDMLSRRLSRRGYDVQVAEDGQQALDLVAAQSFDLVLLDWMMPGLSGIDVLKKLREQYTRVELPIIMATAKTEADDIVEALKHEANDYVTKPLNFDVVNARIKTQLGLVEAHRQLAASERRYRALLENTGDMIVQYRLDGTVTYVSPASRTLLGFEPDELKSRSLYDWMHPLDRRALEAQQRKQPTLPPAFTYISRMIRQDQAYIWVEVSCRLVRGEGEPVVLAACRDVTEHMERLSGDEPPLPLGGDIMAHPGWRGGAGREEAPAPAASPVEAAPGAAVGLPAAAPPRVVVLTMMDGVDPAVVESGSREDLAREVARQLTVLLGEHDG